MAQLPAKNRNQGRHMTGQGNFPMERLRQDFDSLFNRLWGGGWMTPFQEEMSMMRLWDFDVRENEKEITVRAELPGFQENELDVQLSNNVLTIKAEKEQKGEQQQEYMNFSRTVSLPEGIDPEKVQATYRNGVLELHIPRTEGAQPKRIPIQGQQPMMEQAGAASQGQAAAKQAQPQQSETGKKTSK